MGALRHILIGFLSAGSIFLAIACDDVVEAETGNADQTNTNVLSFGTSKVRFPELTSEAKAQVANWSVFDDFQTELNAINGNELGVLKSRTERLKLHADSLSKKIPNDLYTNPITSRLLVLRSRIYLLDQEINKPVIDSSDIGNALNELNSAATNFLVQINEKLQKDQIDLQRIDDEKKELEKQKRFLDSVYEAERRDKNRQ